MFIYSARGIWGPHPWSPPSRPTHPETPLSASSLGRWAPFPPWASCRRDADLQEMSPWKMGPRKTCEWVTEQWDRIHRDVWDCFRVREKGQTFTVRVPYSDFLSSFLHAMFLPYLLSLLFFLNLHSLISVPPSSIIIHSHVPSSLHTIYCFYTLHPPLRPLLEDADHTAQHQALFFVSEKHQNDPLTQSNIFHMLQLQSNN